MHYSCNILVMLDQQVLFQVDTALFLQQLHRYIQVGMGGHKSNNIN